MLDESDILSTTRKQLSKEEFVCQTIGNEYHRVGQVDVISRKRMWHAINCSQLKGPSTFFYPPDMRLLTAGVAPTT